MTNDFIVTPKEERSITMTIRIDKALQRRFDELSKRSNRSRNELMSLALEYALNNLKFVEKMDGGKHK